MKTIECCNCGIEFQVPDKWFYQRKLDYREFYCPNGHPLVFKRASKETRIKELEKELEVLKIENSKPAEVLSMFQHMKKKYLK